MVEEPQHGKIDSLESNHDVITDTPVTCVLDNDPVKVSKSALTSHSTSRSERAREQF